MIFPGKIHTRRGDKSFTSLGIGEQILKTDPRITTLGSVDELSAIIGVVRSFSTNKIASRLREIQVDLFQIATTIASPKTRDIEEEQGFKSSKTPQSILEARKVALLEDWIDEYSETLPPLQNFLLPGGTKASSLLHLARAICRRTEREMVRLFSIVDLNPYLMQYLNRLSDFLFVCARYANFVRDIPDEIVKGR